MAEPRAGQVREKDERDVRWSGRGESREWDRGKVLNDNKGDGKDGLDVEVRAEWGRLKGT